jgi:esterase
MQLHYTKTGRGPAIILLHGLYGNGDDWLEVARYLQDNFTVYMPDMRNHGKSAHSIEFGYDAMVQDIYEMVQEQNLDQVTIMGHSMGGHAAMRFAELYGDLINKLIVIDFSPVTIQTKKRLQLMLRSHVDIINALMNIPVKTISTPEEADDELAKTLPFPELRHFILKNLKRDVYQGFYWQTNLSAIADNIEEIIIGDETMNSVVNCQTLFIKGEMSTYLILNDQDTIKSFFPNMQFKVVKGAGHWVQNDKPEEFKRIITEFLSV